ncbi:MAG TPA: NifU family protein [Polyangiaceae bacterium]|jgi:Fe-S cluster biogenesis protein NfuA|nr:NifU family protein [Polyangiaceae bacterium]
MTTASIDQLLKVMREVVAPLIRADGGEVYVVAVEANHLSVHLAGRYAGCPGTPLVVRGIIEPAIRAVAPTARLEVSNGIHVPEGASLLGP